MVSVYLVMLASVDTFREKKYCEVKFSFIHSQFMLTFCSTLLKTFVSVLFRYRVLQQC